MRITEAEGLIVCLATCLMGLGIVMVYSSDWASSIGIKGSSMTLLRHMSALLLGVGAVGGLMWLDYRRLEPLGYIFLGVAIVGLIVVLIPGIGYLHGGARRWIRFGPAMGFQPSEFAKLALVLFLATWASRNHGRMHEFLRGFLLPISAIGTLVVLALLEPDFGTGTFLGALGVMLLLVAGARWIYVVLSILLATPILYFLIYQAAYRRARLLAFLDPWNDPSGAGYHIIQSWIALGSGGVLGKGLGEGLQKLLFLPECSGDFIFAVVGEELGFLGTFAIIVFFALLVWQGLRVSQRAKEPFGHLLSLGITFMLGYQAAFNMAVVLGCVPTKGIALPFISSGGSSLLLSLAALGLLLSIARHSRGSEVMPLCPPKADVRPRQIKGEGRLSPMGLPYRAGLPKRLADLPRA